MGAHQAYKIYAAELDFSDISNNCCFRWLLNERNKPLRRLVNHYLRACFHLFVFNLQRRQTRLKLLEA